MSIINNIPGTHNVTPDPQIEEPKTFLDALMDGYSTSDEVMDLINYLDNCGNQDTVYAMAFDFIEKYRDADLDVNSSCESDEYARILREADLFLSEPEGIINGYSSLLYGEIKYRLHKTVSKFQLQLS